MKKYNLVPYPISITEKDGFCNKKIGCTGSGLYNTLGEYFGEYTSEIIFENNPLLEKEGYILDITPDGVTVTASTEIGHYYGGVTLFQLVKQFGKTLPCLHIEDKPAISQRGLQMTLGTCGVRYVKSFFEDFVKRASLLKLNEVYLYIEWYFKFDSNPTFLNSNYLTKEQFRYMQDFAKMYGVKIIPQFAFGSHSPDFLFMEANAKYGEGDGLGYTSITQPISAFCLSDEKVKEHLSKIFDEVIEMTDSDIIHIGLDELRNEGKCEKCKEYKEKHGTNGLFLRHIKFIYDYFTARGKKIGIWGDMFHKFLEDSPFWTGWDLEREHDEHNKNMFYQMKDNLVMYDWWYYGSNKKSAEFFRSLGLNVVNGASSNGWCCRLFDLNQIRKVNAMVESTVETNAQGVLCTEWSPNAFFSTDCAQFVHACMADYAWNYQKESDLTAQIEDIVYRASAVLYGESVAPAITEYMLAVGVSNSPVANIMPVKASGVRIRRGLTLNNQPVRYWIAIREFMTKEMLEKMRVEVDKVKSISDRVQSLIDGNCASKFSLSLPARIYDWFIRYVDIMDEFYLYYHESAVNQFVNEEKFTQNIDKCVLTLKALFDLYGEIKNLADMQFKLFGSDKSMIIRMNVMNKNIDKLIRYVEHFKWHHYAMPTILNLSLNLFSMQESIESIGRDVFWEDEVDDFVSTYIDLPNAKSAYLERGSDDYVDV